MPMKLKGVLSHSRAVKLGRLGGLHGGPARARILSAKRRTEIARQGGLARQHGSRSS